MRRLFLALMLLGALLFGASFVPQEAAAQDGGGTVQHVVKAGETLYSISRQYGVTVAAMAEANDIADVNLIYEGQVLTIPARGATPTTTPDTGTETATPDTTTPTATTSPPSEGVVHTVQAGENLFRISLRYGTTVRAIMELNGLENPNIIYVGQQIRIPGGAEAAGTATPTPAATTEITAAATEATTEVTATEAATTETTATQAAPTEAAPTEAASTQVADAGTPGPAATVTFDFGIQIELQGQDTNVVIGRVQELGMRWVRQDIDWGMYEPTKGSIDFAALENLIIPLAEANLNVMLTVTGAPDWARSSPGNGPPTNFQDYADFVGALAVRYQGRVKAYEIWDEPNLGANWNNSPNASQYVQMLNLAYNAIKATDAGAVVVTAGLAPTATNDGVLAIDDRVFLEQMYQAGVSGSADAIGAHAYGFGNPPEADCCGQDPENIPGWNNDTHFFMQETLEAYRAIMTKYNDTAKFIWVTEFGWGSSQGFPVEVDPGFGFVNYVSLDQQSIYTIEAYQLGESLEYVGPMFAWNLNSCQVYGLAAYQCFWSMLDPAGNPRPVFFAVRDLSK